MFNDLCVDASSPEVALSTRTNELAFIDTSCQTSCGDERTDAANLLVIEQARELLSTTGRWHQTRRSGGAQVSRR